MTVEIYKTENKSLPKVVLRGQFCHNIVCITYACCAEKPFLRYGTGISGMPLSVFDIAKRALLMCEMGSIAMNKRL